MSAHHPVILDIGTAISKVGFANMGEPAKTAPTVIGYRFYGEPDIYIGGRAIRMSSMLNMVWPVVNGSVVDWYLWERYIEYMLRYELGIRPDGSRIIMIEPFLTRMNERIKKAEVLFESLNVGELYISTQVMASLFSSRSISGLVLHSSESETVAVPIHNGVIIQGCVRRMSITGREITRRLLLILENWGLYIPERLKPVIVRDMKERLCYVAVDYVAELEKARFRRSTIALHYELPDGQVLELAEERFMVPEMMFGGHGIVDVVVDSILSCDPEIRHDIVSNIVISGGNTMFMNFVKRFEMELKKKLPEELRDRVRISSMENRTITPYVGAHIMAPILQHRKALLTKERWREEGINAVLRML